MEIKETIWYDNNTEPPKNYIWCRNGSYYKYTDGMWKLWDVTQSKGSGISPDMTEQEKQEARKNLGLYCEETSIGEKTAEYANQPQSQTLVGYYKISDDTPAKEDIIRVVYMASTTENFEFSDREDGYSISIPSWIANNCFIVITNASVGNEVGIYTNATLNSSLVYNGEITTINKIDEKYLPETVAKTEDVAKAQVSIVNTNLQGTSQIENPKEGDIETFPEHIIKERLSVADGAFVTEPGNVIQIYATTIQYPEDLGNLGTAVIAINHYTGYTERTISISGNGYSWLITDGGNQIHMNSAQLNNANIIYDKYNFDCSSVGGNVVVSEVLENGQSSILDYVQINVVTPEKSPKEYYDGQWIDRNTAQRTYTFKNPGYEGNLPTYGILNPKCGDVAYCDEKLFTGVTYSSNGEQTTLSTMNLYNLKLKIIPTTWMIYPSGTLTIKFGDNSGWIIRTNKIETFGSGWYEQQSIEAWSSRASIYLDLPPSVIDWMGDTVTCTASDANDYWGIGISFVYPSITEVYDGTTWVRQTTTIDGLKEDFQNNTPSPIKLNTLPDASITTLSGLEAIGITYYNDIKRAANGLCTGIKYSHTDPYTSLDYVELIPIKSAYYDSGNNFRLKFDYGNNEYAINVDGTNGTVSVTVTTT